MTAAAQGIGAHTFLGDLAIVFTVAALTTMAMRALRQPVVLGYLVAGMIVGPHVPIPLVADADRVRVFSELGVILVMFSIGLEFRLERLVRILPTSAIVGAIQISVLAWLGYTAGRLLGWSQAESVFTGAALSISSTMVVSAAFREHPVDAAASDMVFGVLLVQDLAAVAMLAGLTAFASGQGLPASIFALTAGRLAAFLAVLVAVGYLFVPRLVRRVAALGSPETLLVSAVGICFAFSLAAQASGYSVALGAFLAGFLVAESGVAATIRPLVDPVRDVFAAVFFTSIGMMVDPAAIASSPWAVLVLTAVIVAGQMASVFLGSFLVGLDLRSSVVAGMSLCQIGEFSFIIAGLRASSSGHPSPLLSSAVAAAAITTFLTPHLIRGSGAAAMFVDRKLPRPLQTFAFLYGAWLESLRERLRADTPLARVRSTSAFLAIDAVLLAAFVSGAAAMRVPAEAWISARVAVPGLLLHGAFALAVTAVAFPLIVGLARNSRALGWMLASVVLPPVPAGSVDLAAAPRTALAMGLRWLVFVLAAAPVLAFAQPFLPAGSGAVAVLAGSVFFGLALWRSTVNLQQHMTAGAMMLVQAVNPVQAGGARPTDEALSFVPGLGHIASFTVGPGSSAGRTLSELNLRGRTGASVIAIKRAGGDVVAPSGRTGLRSGDVLLLAGTREAVAEAVEVLEGRIA